MHHVCRFLLRCPVACSLSVVLWSCAVAELRRWVVAEFCTITYLCIDNIRYEHN